jgi:hypothetical protein
MAEVTEPKKFFPDVDAHVRPDGDAVVELKFGDKKIGELNFTKFLTKWAEALGWIKKPAPDLKSVP